MWTPRLDHQAAARPAGRLRLRRAAAVVPSGLTAAGLLAAGCATASAAPATAAGSVPAECAASALNLSERTGSGNAGSTYDTLDFTNIGRSACTLDGYPGVSFVTAGPHRSEVGEPAFRDAGFPRHRVVLSPGSTAHADLQVQLAQNYPAALCKPVTADWLRVFPPGSTAAKYLRFSAVTCTGTIPSGSTIGISAVRPGAVAP